MEKLEATEMIITSHNKKDVIDIANKYVKEEGYFIHRPLRRFFRLLKMRWIYEIRLIKPINFSLNITATRTQ